MSKVLTGSKAALKINGVKIEPFAVYSSIADLDNLAGQYREIELNFDAKVDGVDTVVSMVYPHNACVVGAIKNFK